MFTLLHRVNLHCNCTLVPFRSAAGFFVPFVLMVTVATQVAGVARAQAPKMLAVAGLANAITRVAFGTLQCTSATPDAVSLSTEYSTTSVVARSLVHCARTVHCSSGPSVCPSRAQCG